MPNGANSFTDHGVAAPASRSRGATAAVDGGGRPVILVWLQDHAGCRSMLVIDAETGTTRQVAAPPTRRDEPFAVLHSSKNRFYSLYGYVFLEFDPAACEFSFSGKTTDRCAMSMTEDESGVVWAACYPKSGLFAYDPARDRLTDYGSLNEESWPQYPRHLAVDKAGWVYAGIGSTRSHLVAFDPAARRVVPLAREDERVHGMGYVYRAEDGKVYGRPHPKGTWYELHEGRATPLKTASNRTPARAAPIRAGAQGSVFKEFPDGSSIARLDVPDGWADIRQPDGGKTRRVRFEYESEGAYILSLILGPDERIYGSTGHPLRVYRFDPNTGSFAHRGLRGLSGHWNALAVQGGRIYAGLYSGGAFEEYDPAKPWQDRAKREPNPATLQRCAPTINRPHTMLAHPNRRHVIMAGTPGYGLTGGGMLVYDLQSRQGQLLDHEQLLPNHSTLSLVALPGERLLGGTTVAPGTGGSAVAKDAELYLFDLRGNRVTWREASVPGAKEIRDLLPGPDGLVYGIAAGPTFFVFDPDERRVVHQRKLTDYGGPAGAQAPRVLALGPDGNIYALFQDAIVRIEPGTFHRKLLARPPVKIRAGVALHGGRLYFSSGSRLWSYEVPGL